MSTYRINGIKYNPANWAGLDATERAACNRFAAARERELNTITANAYTCDGGPFAGHQIEVESTTRTTAHMTVGAWCGRYELQGNKTAGDKLVWVGNDGGQAINTHHHTTDQKKAGADVTGRGFDQLRDLLADLAEDPAERAEPAPTEEKPERLVARYTIGRTVYTIDATPEAADRLRARITKAKRWFSDKLLQAARPAQAPSVKPAAPAPVPASAPETAPETVPALAAAVAIGTAQAQAAETCAPGATDPRAYVAAAAVDLERLTNSFNYDSTRRAKIEAGRRGELGALSYIVKTLQRLAAQPGHSTGATEARKTLQRLADEMATDAQAMSDQAHQQCGETQARTVRARVELLQILATLPETDAAEDAAELVTCDGPELAETAAAMADTPAAPVDAMGTTDTPAETTPADYTQERETLAQARDYTQARETLRADYLRAADAGHTQQAGSKTGAWSAVMFRTEAGRAGLAFKRPGHPVELVDHATGGERMRALQAMAQAAEQAHRQQLAADTPAAPAAPAADCTQAPETLAPDCTEAPETLQATPHDAALAQRLADQADNFTPEQCEQVARNMEHDNNHGGALMWRCMGARAFDLAARAAANTQAHDRAGHLTDELADQRRAIADELRARLQAAADCTQAPETLAADDEAEKFQRARPQHIDLRHFLAGGVKPAQLVGLGVHYTGDMANAAGEGAIVEAQADDARGVRVAVTLQDGRHMTHLDGASFSDRPGSRFALNAKVHGAPYLAELAAARAALVASTEAAKTSKAQHHAAELVRLAAEFPHLERAESRHAGGKLAARNMRTMLKAAFPGQKFSVTSDYNCVRVRWVDGPTDAAVTAIIGRFDIGRADYNTDYFYTESSAWSELFGGVQYLFTERDESPELLARALAVFNEKYGKQATPDDWKRATGPFDYRQRDSQGMQHWFREILNATDATPPAKTTRKGAKA